MDTLQIQNNICQTIDIIVQNAINNAGFDRTIQAVIMECVNESIGQYKIQYQDSTFYAYAQNPEDKYSAGSGVYILIQNNDMKRDKFIVGTVDKLGKDYLTIVDESERYEMIGINCVSNVEEIQLCSYDSLYYEKDIMNTLSINELDLLTYCENAEFLAIKMNIRTALEREQRRLGNYGLKITLAFKNKEETYKIDINSMIGDPYNYIDYMSQFFVLKFNMENFIGVKNITAFCENFPKQKENMPNDIFIDNLEIYAADRLNEEELRSPRLKFYTPRGTIFKEDLPVTAYLNINGQNINKGEFFWFIEDATIDTNSPYFLPIGGKGWKCINIFDIIKNEEEEYLEVQPFETGYRLFEVNKHLAKHTKYKCVMRYNNDIYTKEIVLQNKQSNYSISIESSDGKTFHNDVGQTVLTCKVLDGELPMSNCIYKWSSIDNNNYINQLQNNTSNITVSAVSIDYFTIYKCMVYTLVENEEVLIGSSEITLTNSIGSEGTYHLIINNDSQTFIYNEEGISPANKNLENPMTILPLNFILYDDQGQEVPHETIYEKNVEWKIPALNSLIQLNEIIAAKDGYYYKNTYDLHFGIKPIYSVNAVNNQIELTIKYQDLVLKAFANLLFTKEGDVGTNGTGVLTRIHAIEKDDSFILQNEEPMMYYNKTKGTYEKNYKELQAIVAEGDQVLTIYPEYSDNVNCNWGILKNRIDSQNLDDSHFDYALGAGFSQKYNSILENVYRIANVINAKITYNNIQYFSVFPMITAFIEDDNYIPYLKKNTGFRSIKYSSDGRYPKYNSALPFTIGIKNNKDEDVDVDSFKFKWGTNDTKTGENTFKYKPQDQYDGRAVNESLICTIYNSSGTQIAKMFIPIYMYLNTYGYSALNDWHGNSIEINNDGGYILTPQIGAGIKNADNTFTGLLMGEMVNGEDKKSGLIGLYNGVQSIFLDSQTGRAEFGKAGAGQIILDPSTNEAIIQSGNFSTGAKSGMQINLSEPTIAFGSGHFSVNKEGKLTANKGSIAGIVMDNDYGLYTNDKTSATSTKAGFLIQKTGNIYLGSYNTQLKSCPLELTSDGNLKAYQGIIGGWTIKSNYLYSKGTSTTTGISSDMNKYAFWAGETNNVMGANNSNAKFRVQHNGSLHASDVDITGKINATTITAKNEYKLYIPLENKLVERSFIQAIRQKSDFSSFGFGIGLLEKITNEYDGYTYFNPELPHLHFDYYANGSLLEDPGLTIEGGLNGLRLYSTFYDNEFNSLRSSGIVIDSNINIFGNWGINMLINNSMVYPGYMPTFQIAINLDNEEHPGAPMIVSMPIYTTTTDKGSNVRITSNGVLRRYKSSSSKRYKHDIKNLNLNEIYGLYNVPVRTFIYNLDYLNKDSERYNRAIPGLIAEEVAEVNDLLVDHNEDGSVEMWNNNILVPCMLKLIQYNHEEINNLKQQVKQLQAKLDNI